MGAKYATRKDSRTTTKRAGTISKKAKNRQDYATPDLTRLDIEHVWQVFYKGKKNNNGELPRNMLMEHYVYLVKYAAERLHSKLPDKVELDDLISAGIFGLMDAIEGYDPKRHVKFETYASPRIKGSILDELRTMDWVPRLVRARSHQLAKATQSLEPCLGRKPTEKELAKELNMTTKEFKRLQQDAHAASLISLDKEYGKKDGSNDEITKKTYEINYIKDTRSPDPLSEAQKRDLKGLLTKGLTRAERLIVVLYYYEEMTMKEIGRTLDLSESRVSQMHSSIMSRLKSQLTSRERFINTLGESLLSLI